MNCQVQIVMVFYFKTERVELGDERNKGKGFFLKRGFLIIQRKL
jgi:hypothetical protein